MRAGGWWALGLAAYSAGLVAWIPAGFVAAQVQQALPGRVEITDSAGTLWHGSARVRLAPSRGGGTLDRVEWRFVPTRLLAGELAAAFNASAPQLHAEGQVARGVSRWELRDVSVTGDAAGLATLIPAIAPWRASGPITIAASSLAFADREATGAIDLQWRDAVSGLSEVRPLGSYSARWSAQNGPGKIVLTTLQGPLRFEGQGTTSAGPRAAFSGEARAEGAQAKALEPLLDLMGPRRPDGARALELRLE